MSFIVTDVPMPNDCWNCPCYGEVIVPTENKNIFELVEACVAYGIAPLDHKEGRHKDCRLFELKKWE